MGTNYYTTKRGSSAPVLHVGKSSGGWCFSLHVIPEDGIKTWEDWKAYLKRRKIVNEYGDKISLKELINIVEDRGWEAPLPNDPEFYKKNYAERGPNNLLRHDLASCEHCIGHGEGTWDYITGIFC